MWEFNFLHWDFAGWNRVGSFKNHRDRVWAKSDEHAIFDFRIFGFWVFFANVKTSSLIIEKLFWKRLTNWHLGDWNAAGIRKNLIFLGIINAGCCFAKRFHWTVPCKKLNWRWCYWITFHKSKTYEKDVHGWKPASNLEKLRFFHGNKVNALCFFNNFHPSVL